MYFEKNSKKAEEIAIQKVVTIILVILVLAAVVVMLSKTNIIDFIRNQPGYKPVNDSESELSCDQLKTLSYDKIGKVVYEKRDWDFVKHWYISFQTKGSEKTQTQCPPADWKEVCVVEECIDLSKIDKKSCDAAKGSWNFHCVSNGRFVYNLGTTNETALYWNYDIGDESSGTLEYSSLGSNEKIGTIKNYFFIIDAKQCNFLVGKGVDKSMINSLHGAKYINGGIYKSKNKTEVICR